MANSAKRRSLKSGDKVEYKDWIRFKRYVQRLRDYHGHSLTSLSLAVGAERGWMDSAIKYPYQCRPREYEAIRKLLRDSTMAFVSPEESDVLRQLIATLRQRGETYTDIGEGSGVHPKSIGQFMNDREKKIVARTRDRMLSYLKKKLPANLIQEAYAALNGESVEEPIGIPESVVTEREAPEEGISFERAQEKLQSAKDDLEELIKGMPKSVQDVVREKVIDLVSVAILELQPSEQ